MGLEVDLKHTSHRREYGAKRLRRGDLAEDPVVQFSKWLDEASSSGCLEPNAMALATCDSKGRPSSRMVLLKEFGTHGFVFATGYESRKGHELSANPHAALLFYWAALERQVRIEGLAEETTSTESDSLFEARPIGARLAARASSQSQPIESREALEAALARETAAFPGETVERPAKWGGYRIVPSSFEFWQGGANRLHDRFLYTRTDHGWKVNRLQP